MEYAEMNAQSAPGQPAPLASTCPTRRVALTALVALVGANLVLASQGPQPLSPRTSDANDRLASRCPTFSWSSDPDDDGYDLVVYEYDPAVGAEANLDSDRRAAAVRLPAGANSWTPTADHCLAFDTSYWWSIRSSGELGVGPWSAPSRFAVAPLVGPQTVEEAVALLRDAHRFDQAAPGPTAEGSVADATAGSQPVRARTGVTNLAGEGTTFTVDGAGNVSAASFAGDGTGLTGVTAVSAALAEAFASDPGNCPAGTAPSGVAADGSAQGCVDVATPTELAAFQPTALASNPSNCPAGNAPAGFGASLVAEGCFDVATQAELTSYQPPALAVNPADCGSGQAPTGISASGAVEGCFSVTAQSVLDGHKTSGSHDGRYVRKTGAQHVTGQIRWTCPPGFSPYAGYCVSNTIATGTFTAAIEACHQQGASVCNYAAMYACDSGGGGSQCAAQLDTAGVEVYLLGVDGNTDDSTFDPLVYVDHELQSVDGAGSRKYFCCRPINR